MLRLNQVAGVGDRGEFFPSSNLPLFSSVEMDKVYFLSTIQQSYFSEKDIRNVLHGFC